MAVTVHDTWCEKDLLRAIRSSLDAADEALLCVAFTSTAGIKLLDRQLERLGAQARLVVTSVFTSNTAALALAAEMGTRIRILNPSGGTYHPKLYLGRSADGASAFIGSANLTSGLVGNIEVGVSLSGPPTEAADHAWQLGEALWAHKSAVDWVPGPPAAPEAMEPTLYALIRTALPIGSTIRTLADGKPNWISEVTPSGVYVETTRSRSGGAAPQLVPSWMIEIAWAALTARGVVTNRDLLDELRVDRSSFVCALLAELPGVTVASTRPITLAWSGAVPLAP